MQMLPRAKMPGVPDRRSVDELSFTTRLTGMADVGENGLFQLGVSGRFVPEFSFDFEGEVVQSFPGADDKRQAAFQAPCLTAPIT